MKNYRTVLITGCSSGIGEATALTLARKGFTVYAAMRDAANRGQKLRDFATKESLKSYTPTIDVTDQDSIDRAIKTIKEPIDILVNNAGFGTIGPVEEFSIDEVKKQYDTNIFGMLRMIKAVAPPMRARGSGLIINISSINGLIPFPLWGIYSSSKYAVESLSESLRFELKHFGVDVSLIEPGSFLTDFPKNVKWPSDKTDVISPYQKLTEKFRDRYNLSHDKAKRSFLKPKLSPGRIADLIYKIATSDKPKLRYIIGIDAHIMYMLSCIMPDKLRNMIFRKAYDW